MSQQLFPYLTDFAVSSHPIPVIVFPVLAELTLKSPTSKDAWAYTNFVPIRRTMLGNSRNGREKARHR